MNDNNGDADGVGGRQEAMAEEIQQQEERMAVVRADKRQH